MTIIKKVKLIPWTNPYATPGLIAMWDGIWNSGSDRHLTNSSICIDLISGRHLPVQFKNDDAFIVPDSTTFKDIDLSGDMTVEWVLDTTEEFIHDLFFAYGNGICYQASGVRAGYLNYQLRYWGGSEYISVYPLSKSVCAAAVRFSKGCFSVFGNGKHKQSYYNAVAASEVDRVVIGRHSAIRSIRFYTRALSDHEIMKNHTLDRHRFNLLE